MAESRRRGLSKSKYVSGTRCQNKLWWEVHEPEAEELQFSKGTLSILQQGSQVGELAREQFPGGVLIDLPYDAVKERVAATEAAIASGVPAIYEASFTLDGVYAAVDVLERDGNGFNLIEVKSSTKVKPEHIPDAALQTHLVTGCGHKVKRSAIMHLNHEYRHPDQGALFVRTDVTEDVQDMIDRVPEKIEELREMLAGDFPALPIGEQCADIRNCPFKHRCWPDDRDHVLKLSGKGVRKALELMADGIHRIQDIPSGFPLSKVNKRQKLALEQGDLAVEPGLKKAMASLESPVGYLDFETVGRAIPVWDGLGPWGAVPVQFSYHEETSGDDLSHVEWLADGPGDPRAAIARALVEATRTAGHIVAYTGFESRQIRHLAAAVPELANELEDINGRLFDLHKVVKDNVYHPDFDGSFSIKDVLPVLVPELGYDDLEIDDGQDASAEIARLMLEGDNMSEKEQAQLREDLLKYCKRDTEAMVGLVGRLRVFAAEA